MPKPCNWPVEQVCASSATVDETAREWAEQTAITVLWAATGRRFGLCEVTVRPCRERDATFTPSPGQWFWQWYPIYYTCSCMDSCSCSVDEVKLPGRVHSVVGAKINGVSVDPDALTVIDHSTVSYIGGWPVTQNLDVPDDDEGTWSITYLQGDPPPAETGYMTGLYACELLKSISNDKSCRLPAHVTQLNRGGVSMNFLDPQEYIRNGLTGLPIVDTWIMALNPHRLHSQSSVVAPWARTKVRSTS